VKIDCARILRAQADGKCATSVVQAPFDPMEDWREVATNVHGRALQCGHFIPEEKPKELLAELRRFFARS